MARVLVPLAPGFEEIEAITIVDVLRRAGVDVVLAGLRGAAPALGSRGVSVLPDAALDDLDGPWDLVVLPGGMGGTLAMREHAGLRGILSARGEDGEPVAAICAAPMVLDAVGLLTDGAFTHYPGLEGQVRASGRRDERVVDAGAVITSQGPATAMDFALHLVERLMGPEARTRVAAGLLHR